MSVVSRAGVFGALGGGVKYHSIPKKVARAMSVALGGAATEDSPPHGDPAKALFGELVVLAAAPVLWSIFL